MARQQRRARPTNKQKRPANKSDYFMQPGKRSAVIVLRKKRPDLHRAFRCAGVPVVPVLAIAFCAVLMAFLSRTTWAAFLTWLVLGLVVYFGYARQRSLLNHPASHASGLISEDA